MKINYLCISFLFILTSCLEDIGNYNYKNINEIIIEGVTDKVLYDLISHQDHLKISPTLVGVISGEDLSNFSYEWKLVPIDAYELPEDKNAYIVSREKDIDYLVVESPGEYYGLFRVKDEVTGNVFSKRFFVQVRSLTTEGWAILCNDDGKTRFDWLFRQTEEKQFVLSNIWAQENYHSIMGNPIGLSFAYEYGTGLSLRLVATEKGTYNLDGIEQKAGEDRNVKYLFGDMLDNIQIVATAPMIESRSRTVTMIISKEGDVYTRKPSAVGDVFGYRENKLLEEDSYFVAAPFIGLSEHKSWDAYGSSIALYDQVGCRFVEYTTSSQYAALIKWQSNDKFPSTSNLEMIDMQNVNTRVFSILRDKETNETHFFGFKLGNSGVNTQEFYMKLDGDGINETTVFAYDPLWSHILYAHDKKIYKIKITNNTEAQNPGSVAYSSQEDIVKMIFPDYSAWTQYPKWFIETKNKLHVAGNNPSTNKGVIRIFGFTNSVLIQEKEITEGLGKIVDIEYFERE